MKLAVHCAFLRHGGLENVYVTGAEQWDYDSVLNKYMANPAFAVVRMSLASPWTVVLSDVAVVAERNTWVGYLGGGLVVFERLLKSIMRWQRNQQGLRERESARKLLEGHMSIVASQRQDVGGGETVTRIGDPGLFSDQYWKLLENVVERMGRVIEAEIVSDDDPRVTGKK